MGVNSCGTTMLDQGAFVGLASIDWDTTPKTANFTAVSGNGYFVNTTSSAITLTLPAGSAGDTIAVSDYASTFGVPETPAVYSNPESGLGTADLTVSTVSNFSAPSATVRAQDLYSAVDVGGFTASDYGVIWESGGTGQGFAASLKAGGELYVAAYDGDPWADPAMAYLLVDVSSYYNTPGTFYTTIDQSAKQFNLYFQPGGPTSGNQAISLGTSTAGTDANWTGTAGGGMGQQNGGMPNFGFTNYNQPFTASVTELRWYYNTAEPSPFQSITTPAATATPLTISPNGTDKINGTNENATITTNGICFTLIYVDSTQGWKSIESNSTNPTGEVFITATGGTITTDGDFKIHTFTGPGTFTVSSLSCAPANNFVDYAVTAGGAGGGSRHGGGGGGGGYRESCGGASGCYSTSPLANPCGALPVSVQGYPVTVGGGGAGGPGPASSNGSPGSNSIFNTITSAGGGYGSGLNESDPGGSGGGAGFGNTSGGDGNTPPTSPPQGSDGGRSNGYQFSGGGGGGATAAGTGTSPTRAGDGGAGATSSINGSPVGRAGGGGGGSYFDQGAPTPGGLGGVGGGGEGGDCAAQATSGSTNTGGGGGGGASSNSPATPGSGGAGGSGVVIIRYRYQ